MVRKSLSAEGFENVKAPSQIVTYVSAHDNHTLWDKLKGTVVEEKECMRLNKMAASVYMTCRGNAVFLIRRRICPHKRWIG